MTLLHLLASAGTEGATTPPPPVPADDSSINTQGYTWPAAAPYNPATYLATPTPDGSGAVVHPDVVDMRLHTASGRWRGFRFWLAITPYWNSNYGVENPNLRVSDNGIDWYAHPDDTIRDLYTGGIIVPAGQAPSLSDTDLVYDADTDSVVLVFREYAGYTPYREVIFAVRSTDGTTWSTPTPIVDTVSSPSSRVELSPAMVRRGPGDWLLFTGNDGQLRRRTATDPVGAWSAPVPCTLTGPGSGVSPWHHDIIHDAATGHLYGLLNNNDLRPAVSVDGGLTWTVGPPFIASRSGLWDAQVYRGTIQPKGASSMRVWYSANGSQNWRAGYTEVPRALWSSLVT